MLQSLELKNFTVFEQANFQFSSGLNVLIGENGTGKTHVLKAAYSFVCFLFFGNATDETYEQVMDFDKFQHVFKTPSLNELITNTSSTYNISIKLSKDDVCGQYSMSHKRETPDSCEISFFNRLDKYSFMPIFLPAKEILSIYPNFIALYEKYHLAFDDTYYDICKSLQNPLLRKLAPPEKLLLGELEQIIGAKVVLEGEHFYLQMHNSDDLMSINMVAEGHRKIAMLAYLIANDSIKKGITLFWDEPESSLNPKLIKDIAKAIMALCKNGIQVILATHSLFLLRELEILKAIPEYQTVPTRFFGLHKQGDNVVVEQDDSLDGIGDIVALDEQLAQSDRFMALEV